MDTNKNLVLEVFFLDGPFICGVYGNVTLSELKNIEHQIIENADEMRSMLPENVLTAKYIVSFIDAENQQGSDPADVMVIPSYFDFVLLDYSITPDIKSF